MALRRSAANYCFGDDGEFIEQVPAFLRPLISASDKWSWRQQRRKLSDAAAPYPRAAL